MSEKGIQNNLDGGKNLVSLIPAHWAEAHSAEVYAKHLDTRPETLPVKSDSPAKQSEGVQRTKEKGGVEHRMFRWFTSKTMFSSHQKRHDSHFFDSIIQL